MLNKKLVSEIKWLAQQPCQLLHKILINWPVSLVRNLICHRGTPLKCLFLNKYILNFLKDSKEKGSFKILPTYGVRAYRPVGLDRRQLGLVGKEGKLWIVEI